MRSIDWIDVCCCAEESMYEKIVEDYVLQRIGEQMLDEGEWSRLTSQVVSALSSWPASHCLYQSLCRQLTTVSCGVNNNNKTTIYKAQ